MLTIGIATLITTSIFLGIGLAMDACSVSMANGLNEPKMKLGKVLLISIMFGFFQAAMPLLGYFVGSAVLQYIEKFIPWIALGLLLFVGGKMIIDGIKGEEEEEAKALTFKVLIVQAIATSIDALSVGFTIADYKIIQALVCTFLLPAPTQMEVGRLQSEVQHPK